MAIDIGPIAKPQIRLVGNIINPNEGDYNENSQRVDNAISLPAASTNIITGVTRLNKEDILTYHNTVRIIITGFGQRPVYVRESTNFSTSEYEGKSTYSNKNVGEYAETWFTYNGKDPVRNKAHLYNFKDWNDHVPGDSSNVDTLGFVLKTSPTGNNIVTLKAKTYYRGNESRIAVITFKIAHDQVNLDYYQPPR